MKISREGLQKFSVWLAQIMIAVPFTGIAIMKLTKPLVELAAGVPWALEYPIMVRVMGAIDLLGAIGMVLPALTRLLPGLTVWAAIGCVALMVCAIIFHLTRGEAWATSINMIYLLLAAYVWWGRAKRFPIVPRSLKKI
ncbi:DoxX family protein [Aquisediminimonas profunda]|uniref:DoxX family protein n=1 Tax=Aquisediminimonas profunda TaxID=1550733 RepID=UPI001C62E536|nr:DoxX family protein [Aquisediminimonas profunda]